MIVSSPALSAPAVGAGPGDAANQLSTPLTLDRAIRIALANQQTLRIANSQLQAARAQVVQAASTYYPQIGPTYQYTNQKSASSSAGGGSNVVEGQFAEIAAQQLIFDTGKRENTVALKRHGARAAEFTALDERQNVILNVTADFFNVLRDKELVRVAEASVTNSKATLDSTRAFVEAGTARKIDTYQAEADYNNFLVQLSQARNNVSVALATLRNALGITTPVQIVTDDTPPALPSAAPDTTSVQEYVKRAFASRLDLKSNSESVGAQKSNLNLARIAAGPQVQANFSIGYQVEPDTGSDRTFMTTLTYPLFDAGSTAAGVRAAKAAVDQAREVEEQNRQTILLDVETALDLREEARARLGATQSALVAATKNFEAARDSQHEGASSILDVIQAQTALVTAQTNAVQALYDFHTADAQLRRAIGDNDPYRTEKSKP